MRIQPSVYDHNVPALEAVVGVPGPHSEGPITQEWTVQMVSSRGPGEGGALGMVGVSSEGGYRRVGRERGRCALLGSVISEPAKSQWVNRDAPDLRNGEGGHVLALRGQRPPLCSGLSEDPISSLLGPSCDLLS